MGKGMSLFSRDTPEEFSGKDDDVPCSLPNVSAIIPVITYRERDTETEQIWQNVNKMLANCVMGI